MYIRMYSTGPFRNFSPTGTNPRFAYQSRLVVRASHQTIVLFNSVRAAERLYSRSFDPIPRPWNNGSQANFRIRTWGPAPLSVNSTPMPVGKGSINNEVTVTGRSREATKAPKCSPLISSGRKTCEMGLSGQRTECRSGKVCSTVMSLQVISRVPFR